MTIRSARNPIVFSPYWGGDYVGLSGSARTLDPTNKNYAPELSTFGTIIEVNRSEVQWSSLSLEKLPSWSQLISAPGKYELSGRDFRLSTLCTNCGDPGWGGVDWQIMFLPWQGFKYHIQIKRFDNRQISDNKYKPVQTFCWTETGIFRENRNQAYMSDLATKPATTTKLVARQPLALRRGDTVINDRIERCCYC